MTPLYKQFIQDLTDCDRTTFTTKEASDWLEENRKDPSTQLWSTAVHTQIIQPASKAGLIVRLVKGTYNLVDQPAETSLSKMSNKQFVKYALEHPEQQDVMDEELRRKKEGKLTRKEVELIVKELKEGGDQR